MRNLLGREEFQSLFKTRSLVGQRKRIFITDSPYRDVQRSVPRIVKVYGQPQKLCGQTRAERTFQPFYGEFFEVEGNPAVHGQRKEFILRRRNRKDSVHLYPAGQIRVHHRVGERRQSVLHVHFPARNDFVGNVSQLFAEKLCGRNFRRFSDIVKGLRHRGRAGHIPDKVHGIFIRRRQGNGNPIFVEFELERTAFKLRRAFQPAVIHHLHRIAGSSRLGIYLVAAGIYPVRNGNQFRLQDRLVVEDIIGKGGGFGSALFAVILQRRHRKIVRPFIFFDVRRVPHDDFPALEKRLFSHVYQHGHGFRLRIRLVAVFDMRVLYRLLIIQKSRNDLPPYFRAIKFETLQPSRDDISMLLRRVFRRGLCRRLNDRRFPLRADFPRIDFHLPAPRGSQNQRRRQHGNRRQGALLFSVHLYFSFFPSSKTKKYKYFLYTIIRDIPL